ncbi:hypothetical protein LTR04_001419 [Oleoguttula sp. CCFEE 6159]|nr:hypothetical protein LTR04_001419 [Oleoguttula sp. CCFEE 6159]
MFIIQAGIILVFCRILHYPLSKLRQPRVIAEVIGGVLLGPSVMGRVPGFTAAIFPTAAMPNLTLVANLGLVLFLFLVGLEVDLRYLASNWKVALSVGAAGMALPFGLGCAIAWGLYNQFRNEPGTVHIGFGVYMLFIGIAMAITAFPVLCRILTELKLLSTPVGIVVLSAGVGNDVVGWILLALCVALVNTGTGLTALWVLLTCLGYILFLVPSQFDRASCGFFERLDGPSQSVVALTLLIALTSSFFTGIIGVHPIFGAFLAGLICPHEGGFAIKVTEKIEDLVSTLFLPLYFALSGLSTNLGLLNDGITWAYVIGVIAIAFLAKFTGGAFAARLNGLVWRESFTIGTLMSCKGLVELIVLNIGLQAKILSTRTFTIFVVMALVTTFGTTPLTAALYPPWYQKKLEAWKRGEIDWDTGSPLISDDGSSTKDIVAAEKLESGKVQRLLVYLRLDNMPTLLAFVSLLGGRPQALMPRMHPQQEAAMSSDGTGPSPDERLKRPIDVHGVRLLQLTERDSSVMKVSEVEEYSIHDPVINTFRTFGQLHNLAVSGEVTVVPESSYADVLITKASDMLSDLMLLPWSETGSMSEAQMISTDVAKNKLYSASYSNFIATTLENASCNAAIFVNNGFGGRVKQKPMLLTRSVSGLSLRHHQREHAASTPVADRSHHVFFPFFGGADDRVALRLVLQMAENQDVTATLIHYHTTAASFEDVKASTSQSAQSASTSAKRATTALTPTASSERDAAFFSSLRHSLPADLAMRVLFESKQSTNLLADAMEQARAEVGQSPRNAGDLIVLGRNVNANVLAADAGTSSTSSEARGCLGPAAEAVVASGIRASVLVVQARGKGLE